MSSIYGNSFTNSYGIKNTGLGGLASGLNTEEIVEALTYGTRSKIAKQNQQLQVLKWQQTAYRSVRSSLYNFNASRFTLSGSTGGASNITNPKFFNTYKGISSSDKVSLVGDSTTRSGTVKIDEVLKLATNETITVENKFDTDLTGKEFDFPAAAGTFYGKELIIRSADTGRGSQVIRLDELDALQDKITNGDYFSDSKYHTYVKRLDSSFDPGNPATYPTLTYEQAFQIELQFLVDDTFGVKTKPGAPAGEFDSIIDVTVDEPTAGKLTVNLESVSRISVDAKCDVLGFAAEQTNKLDLRSKLSDVFDLSGDVFKFSVNGHVYTMRGDDSVDKLIKTVNDSANGVRMMYSNNTNSFILTAEATGTGKNIDIKDIEGNLMKSFMGAPGSSKITSSALGNPTLGYSKEIKSDSSVNVETLLDSLNSSGKSAVITVTVDGKDYDLELKNVPKGVPGPVEGVQYYETMTAQNWLVYNLNKSLQGQLAKDDITDNIGFEYYKESDGTFKLALRTPVDREVTISDPATLDPATQTSLISEFNFTALTNDQIALGTGTATSLGTIFDEPSGSFIIQDWQGNDVTINWDDTMDLRDFLNDLNTAFNPSSDTAFARLVGDRIVFNAGIHRLDIRDVSGTAIEKLFGFGSYNTDPVDLAHVDRVVGQNAEIVVDGQVYSSYTNTFNMDGIAFEVRDLHIKPTDPVEAANHKPITITSKSDPDELIDKLQDFVDEYNALVQSLNRLIYEEKTGHSPLTDEQRAEMSEDQIRNWENEAKKGLLRNDQTLRTIVDGLRRIVGSPVEAAGICLADIGITTGGGYKKADNSSRYDMLKIGTLEIDEPTLRKAIETNPDAIRVLFTYDDKVPWNPNGDEHKSDHLARKGIAHQMSALMDSAINTSSGSDRGSLVRIAGIDGLTGDNESEIGRKIGNIDKYVSTLKIRLENEYTRHWKKFTALETAIQRMNAQSSWLMDFGAQ